MITLRNREGTRVNLDSLTIDDARQIAPALGKGWALVETVEQEIVHEPAHVPARHIGDEPAKAPRTRKSAGERKPRAEKPADEAVINDVLAVMRAAGGPVKMADLSANVAADGGETAIKRAVAVLVADGRVTVNGKARGTTYSLPAVAA